jgi:hypothetical protein
VCSVNPGVSDTQITTIWMSIIMGTDPQGKDRQSRDQAAAEPDTRRHENEPNRTGIGPDDADEITSGEG